jgi:hypothetical protein
MARIGTFTGMGGGPYGASLSTVHPIDNYVPNPAQQDITDTLSKIPRTIITKPGGKPIEWATPEPGQPAPSVKYGRPDMGIAATPATRSPYTFPTTSTKPSH